MREWKLPSGWFTLKSLGFVTKGLEARAARVLRDSGYENKLQSVVVGSPQNAWRTAQCDGSRVRSMFESVKLAGRSRISAQEGASLANVTVKILGRYAGPEWRKVRVRVGRDGPKVTFFEHASSLTRHQMVAAEFEMRHEISAADLAARTGISASILPQYLPPGYGDIKKRSGRAGVKVTIYGRVDAPPERSAR